MISVSEELKNAFNTGNQKDLTLYFSDNTSLANENIVAESMSLEQILCDEEQITFGLCNSSSFKITILNSNTSRVGQTVTPVITIRGTEYSMQLGVFKIVEDKVTDDRLHRNITAYDALYDIVNTDYASWYTSLTFPMTLKQFRDAFFEHIDLTQVSASLINDSMTVEKTVDADVFSGSDIIKAICELNAVFGCIDNEGNFKYIPFVHEGGLYPEEDLFPADDLYPNDGFDVIVSGSPYSYVSGSFVYEDYVVQRITGLAIVEDESDTSELYGTDDNLYMITGNYLLFGKNATDLRTVAENFLGFVGRFQYKPARIRMRAMPWVELGDIIGVVGKKGNAVFPILKRTMSGITALYDDYEAQGKEYYSFSANTVSSMVEKLKSKTMRIVANVDEISTELTEYEESTDNTLGTIIEQSATSIRLSASGGDLTTSLTIQLYNEDGTKIDEKTTGQISLRGSVAFVDPNDNQTYIYGNRIKTGVITSNNGTMTIDLDNNKITANTLVVNASNFKVDANGNVICTNATLNQGSLTLTYDTQMSPYGGGSSYNVTELLSLAQGSISLGCKQQTSASYSEILNIHGAVVGEIYTSSGVSPIFGTIISSPSKGIFGGLHFDTSVHADHIYTSEVVRGKVSITPTAGNQPTSIAVSWNMPSTPTVVATADTGSPGTSVLGVGVSNVSTTGCTITVTRTNTNTTGVFYIATCVNS